MSRVLAVGDLHAPFDHPNYLRFLKETAKTYGTDQVLFIGDVFDQYALSRFTKDPDGYSAHLEWNRAKKHVSRYHSEFPNSKWVLGNHDRRGIKKVTDGSVPEEWLKDITEIYGVPTWQTSHKFTIDGVEYVHGEGAGGTSGWQNFPLKLGNSVVFGHYHSIFGTRYHRSPHGQLFSAATGCGVDEEAYAFRYAKFTPQRPVIGCQVIVNGIQAIPVLMDLGERRNARIRRNI